MITTKWTVAYANKDLWEAIGAEKPVHFEWGWNVNEGTTQFAIRSDKYTTSALAIGSVSATDST